MSSFDFIQRCRMYDTVPKGIQHRHNLTLFMLLETTFMLTMFQVIDGRTNLSLLHISKNNFNLLANVNQI